ncbi:hypothetical protein NZK27_07905 [Synechococcus sp. FGCU-3]|jgi:hypothetical protein|nr:hypothetical protein [Synechococcus sp. FGCU3]
MNARNWLVSGALVVLCGGILVLFTDIEVSAVRWFSCGPLAPQDERTTEICR